MSMQYLSAQNVAVITGASSGIGAATAQALARAGATVVLLARRADRIANLVDDIQKAGGHAFAIEADVADLAALPPIARQVHDKVGRTNILVNNAGIAQCAPFARQDSQEWRAMVDTNLLGVLYTTHAFLPQLLDGGGTIINVSSVGGRTTSENMAVYSTTKFGVVGWSDALRKELADQGVRVAIVEPGLAQTEIQEHMTDPTTREKFEEQKQMTQPLQAQDIAEAITYIASAPTNVCVNELQIRPIKEK